MRAFDPVAYDTAKRAILAWNREGDVGAADFRCRVAVALTNETVPWPRNPGSLHLFTLGQEAGRDLGLARRSEERGGLSDGNVLWDFCPTRDGLGPRGESCHCSEMNAAEGKEQEWVDVTSVVPNTVVTVSARLRLLGEIARRQSGQTPLLNRHGDRRVLRQRERHERWNSFAVHRERDVLLVVDHVGHRCPDRRARQIH